MNSIPRWRRADRRLAPALLLLALALICVLAACSDDPVAPP